MDATPHPPKLILGVESGTAILAVITCLTFAVTIFAIAGSFVTAGLATLALTAAIPVTSRLLPSHSVPLRCSSRTARPMLGSSRRNRSGHRNGLEEK